MEFKLLYFEIMMEGNSEYIGRKVFQGILAKCELDKGDLSENHDVSSNE